MKTFWIDTYRNIKVTFEDLLLDLSKSKINSNIIGNEDPYQCFKDLLLAFSQGDSIELLDYDFSSIELENLKKNQNITESNKSFDTYNWSDVKTLLEAIKNNWEKVKVSLYTSGTTGKPKKVTHTLKKLSSNIKTGSSFSNNVWGFAYNPTHFAGMQVFLQAIFNQNTIINLIDLNQNEIMQAIAKYKITNISATPTFYRKLLSYNSQPMLSVERVTFGGEKFDLSFIEKISKIFPNAKIRNLYASTEIGGLFSSKDDIFTIHEKIKPFVKFTNDWQLLIHKSMVGEFDQTGKIVDGMYYTGDFVEMISESSFRFIGRNSEFINVGGYKVNPHEVENEIRKVEGVVDVTVKARKNSVTGNIVTAEVEKLKKFNSEKLQEEILAYLKPALQSFKIPRIIKFVDKLDITKTGKKKRL